MENSPPDGVQAGSDLQIRLLGELRVTRGGHALALPASKRSRALLAYLVGTASPQTRQHLCDLLWDGPGDPRAELRWSLSKLRPVIDEAALHRIAADRERVAFAPHGATVDTVAVRALLAEGVQAAGTAALEQAAAMMAGDFLEGLELPACYRFHQWCMAEREWYCALRLKILTALLQRLDKEPERALAHARALALADPLSEPGHAAIVRQLLAVGRPHDAEAHCRYAENLFRRELGAEPGREWREAVQRLRLELHQRAEYTRQARHAMPANDGLQPEPAAHIPAPDEHAEPAGMPLVGRDAERKLIHGIVDALGPGRQAQAGLLLFCGEAGIGKTRLLDLLGRQAAQAACRVLAARCFEAEMMRPYGIWIDALRPLAAELPPDIARRDLGALMPAAGAAGADAAHGAQGDRARLFAACAALLKQVAAKQPLVLILDDLQWLDEGSSALLHYLVRSAEPDMRRLLAGAARPGEIDDNPWAKGLLQSLTREHRLHTCQLLPLDPAEVAALVRQVAASAAGPGPTKAAAMDAQHLHRLSGGNPLFALALAQADDWRQGSDFSWQALTADQVQRLDQNSRELVCWAAAMGRAFHPETLCSAMQAAESDFMLRLDRLERRGLLKPGGEGRYDFAHDLLREAVYRQLSPPRRRAIHRQIAHVLQAAAASDASLHGELAHHASQAGDLPLAVRACIGTAQHCLRVYANAEASSAANRGLAMLPGLAGAERINAHIELLGLSIVANAGAKYLPAQVEELQKAVDTAEAVGLYAAAASGLHMLSWLAQQDNDAEHTRTATLRAERISRTADAATHCTQLANSGRCLLEVEADVVQARALIQAAAEQADAMNMRLIELDWGRALIARWDGQLDAASDLLRIAVETARAREDRWREFECMVWLATVELERGRYGDVIALCHEVDGLAGRMGDLKAPVSHAMRGLAQLRQAPADPAPATAALQAGLNELRALDDKAHLAYVQNQVAALLLERGLLQQAQAAATEALAAAQTVRRATEVAVAQALLAEIASQAAPAGTPAALPCGPERLDGDAPPSQISARAYGFVQRMRANTQKNPPAKRRNRKIPTAVPTKAD